MRKGYPSKLRRSVVGYASAGFAEAVKMPRAEARGALRHDDVTCTNRIQYELIGHLPRESPDGLIPGTVGRDYVIWPHGFNIRDRFLNELGFGSR